MLTLDSEETLEKIPKSGEIDDAATEALDETCDTYTELETPKDGEVTEVADIDPSMETMELDTVWTTLTSGKLLEIAVCAESMTVVLEAASDAGSYVGTRLEDEVIELAAWVTEDST